MRPEPDPVPSSEKHDPAVGSPPSSSPRAPLRFTPVSELTPAQREEARRRVAEAKRKGDEAFERGEQPGRVTISVPSMRIKPR